MKVFSAFNEIPRLEEIILHQKFLIVIIIVINKPD